MKKLLLVTIFVISYSTFSMAQCNGRYFDPIFTTLTTTSDVVYGSNTNINNQNQILHLDIYEPQGDTCTNRPLLIMGHGGSFVGGTKTDQDVVKICQEFAKRGYVCCSYEYRLGMGIPSTNTAPPAVYRATQDGKAVVRFFRKDRSTSNTYKIDTSQIFLGGSSAGAFIALHAAYMDSYAELPASIDTSVLGDLEGNSGNPGYSSKVKGVINLCGALGSAQYMHAGDVPLCSMHGTVDGTVPYGHATIYVFGIPIMVVDGSGAIKPHADSVGVEDYFFRWSGANHVPYAGTSAAQVAYMDTTIEWVRDFMYHHLDCSNSLGIIETNHELLNVFPNPTNGDVTIELGGIFDGTVKVKVIDVTGMVIYETSKYRTDKFKLPSFQDGIYFINVSDGMHKQTKKIVVMN